MYHDPLVRAPTMNSNAFFAHHSDCLLSLSNVGFDTQPTLYSVLILQTFSFSITEACLSSKCHYHSFSIPK